MTKPGRVALLRELRGVLGESAVAEAAAYELWDEAEYREERYVAVSLARTLDPTPTLLPRWRHWIVTGAWWDHVDEIAAHLVGPILRAAPADAVPVIVTWSREPDSAPTHVHLCQLGSADRTDTELLATAIEASSPDNDFFIRKGIGWALRQYARTDPEWVTSFFEPPGAVGVVEAGGEQAPACASTA